VGKMPTLLVHNNSNIQVKLLSRPMVQSESGLPGAPPVLG